MKIAQLNIIDITPESSVLIIFRGALKWVSFFSGCLPSAAASVLRAALAKRAEKRRLRDKRNAPRLTNEPRQRLLQCDAEADLEQDLLLIQPVPARHPRPTAQGTGLILPAAAAAPTPDLGCDQNVSADTDKREGGA
jgi:hypothetical protein